MVSQQLEQLSVIGQYQGYVFSIFSYNPPHPSFLLEMFVELGKKDVCFFFAGKVFLVLKFKIEEKLVS